MRAIAARQARPIEHPDALEAIDVEAPRPGPRDLLVRVQAVSVNPVDTKIRQRLAPGEGPRILGWDAVGEVVEVGSAAAGFVEGERVWYAGALTRPGSNAELQAVDHRLVAHAPTQVSALRAASLPLTSLTAWELLFERLGLVEGGSAERVLLVSGGAGGVGSILVQLARALTQVRIVATSGRAESSAWLRELGAHDVISYREPLLPQLRALGLPNVTDVASLTHTDAYLAQFAECFAPCGRLALIDDPPALDLRVLKPKSVSVHWEFMYTRSLFETADMAEQGAILARVAELVDAGRVRTTEQRVLAGLSVESLREAHQLLESGASRGKIVLPGFA